MGNVTDNELQEFCRWYKNYFCKREEKGSVIETCLCGRFHTYTKRAKELLKRCESLNLLAIKKDIVFIK